MFGRHIGALLAKQGGLNIIGLKTVPKAREVLIGLYNETLKAVRAIPSEALYRQTIEKLTEERLQVCQEETQREAIEEKIASGHLEELIWQAEDELKLIPKMAEWKPWEVPEGHTVEINIEANDPVPLHVPSHFGTKKGAALDA